MPELIILFFFMAQVGAVATQGYARFFFVDGASMGPSSKSDTTFPYPFLKATTK